MIGTNRDLKSIQRILDSRITELSRLSAAPPEEAAVFDRLADLRRERITVAAALVNRRIESAKRVVDLSRWFTGGGVLLTIDPDHRGGGRG
jgi:hypothetical protein